MFSTGCRRRWNRRLAIGSWLAITSWGNCAVAQIIPDGTLPNNSRVTGSDNITIIEGGTTSGSNLFHSFEQFSVFSGNIAHFNNALDIQNIISRVTGRSVSNINGLIRANGAANLFLINPNGIIFGPNASLNIGGSFLASTASSLKFADGEEFSATAPQTTPLLTISVPIGLQLGEPKSIRNQSRATTTNSRGVPVGLQVNPGKTLALVGGEMTLEGGYLTAAGGRIELGSVASNGLVSLNPTDKGWVLGYEGVDNFQDIKLSQRAVVDASGTGGGNIQLRGRNVTLTDGSQIATKTLGSGLGGNLSIRASEFVLVSGESTNPQDYSRLTTRTEGAGNAGDLTITTRKLVIENGAQVSSGTFGTLSKGQGGTLIVTATDSVEVSGAARNGVISRLTTRTEGAGNAGDVTINTGKLIVEAGGQISANTLQNSTGQGGTLTVRASELVQVSGESLNGNDVSSLTTRSDGTGNAGDLTINTGKLIVEAGGEISADTLQRTTTGQGGTVTVNASESVQVSGASRNRVLSRLTTRTQGGGNAGDLTITTGRLVIENGAQVSSGTDGRTNTGNGGNLIVRASESVLVNGESTNSQDYSRLTSRTEGDGNAGDLTITTAKLVIENGAQVSAGTFGKGSGGTLNAIATDSVQVSGAAGNGVLSRLTTRTQGSGNAGDLTIDTRNLIVEAGGEISAGTLLNSTGQGGTLTVNALDSVFLSGESPDGSDFSRLTTRSDGTGNAGDLTINTGKLIVEAGGQISASTSLSSTGDGGTLIVNASDLVLISGAAGNGVLSRLTTRTQGTGDAGDLTINTGKLVIENGAQVSSGTDSLASTGDGGNLTIRASESVLVSGESPDGKDVSRLTARTEGTGNAGDLTITTGKLVIENGAQVSAGTLSEGQGGNLNVRASESVFLSGASRDGVVLSRLATRTQGAGDATGLTITTPNLIVRDRAEVDVRSFNSGKAGNLEVTARSIELDNQGKLTAETSSVDGGNIRLRDLDLLVMRRNSQISTNAGRAQAGGNGGNIDIDAKLIVAVPSENSDIVANAFLGRGGNINITTEGIYGLKYRPQRTEFSDINASSQFGVNGTVQINTPGIDPSLGLVNLPTVPVATEVAQGCTAGGSQAQNEFIITGRGGLPPNPGDALSTDAVQVDLVTLDTKRENASRGGEVGRLGGRESVNSNSPHHPIAPSPIVEATGWVIDANGDVVLIANAPTVTSHSSWQKTADCRAFNQQQGH